MTCECKLPREPLDPLMKLVDEILALEPDHEGDVILFADESGHNLMIEKLRQYAGDVAGALEAQGFGQ